MAGQQSNMQSMQKYPSMSSVHTMVSLGYIPPGHGYIPKKQKPEKPFGLPYITIMNRTIRGPGKKYLTYALASAVAAVFLFLGGGLYFGHRNVSRMIVMRTESLGAIMIMLGIVCVSIMGRYCAKARIESNRWRAGIRFKPEGLHTAAPINVDYVPEMAEIGKLRTGTYGPRALREIPKPKYMKKKKKKRSRAPSKQDLLNEDGSGTATPRLYQQHGYAPAQYAGGQQYPRQPQPHYDAGQQYARQPQPHYDAGQQYPMQPQPQYDARYEAGQPYPGQPQPQYVAQPFVAQPQPYGAQPPYDAPKAPYDEESYDTKEAYAERSYDYQPSSSQRMFIHGTPANDAAGESEL